MENDKIRINKIAITVDRKYNEVKVSLYKTNELLGILSDEDLNIQTFKDSGISYRAYQEYVRDYVIEFIRVGCIPGYYYEPKVESESEKYDNALFISAVKTNIEIFLEKYNYNLEKIEERMIDAENRYKDNTIKDAYGEFNIKIDGIIIPITVNIKSGQLCKPKNIIFNDQKIAFNITNIKNILKDS